jgi:pimeloyl-ACP methyl ester carboxylesterase
MAVSVEVELFGGPEMVFGCRHMPASPPGAAVLICPGGPFEPSADEGRGARLGHRLAARGVAVQRFHYRGTGSSDGDPQALSFERLVDDARRALRVLCDRGRADRLGFVGTRLGALVAARLAREHPSAPLAVWEPVVDPRRVLERAVAAGRDAGRADGAAGEPGVTSSVVVDLLETPLAVELFEGTMVGGLADEIGDLARPLLLVDAGDGSGGSIDGPIEGVASRCRAAGGTVEVARASGGGRQNGAGDPALATDELVDSTADWLLRHLNVPGQPAGPPTGEVDT